MEAQELSCQLKSYWYIAAEAKELRSRPLARTVLGEPLVLFRQSNGHPAALIDRCAHRNMALSRGTVLHDLIECPYHGWRYDEAGKCVRIASMSADRKTADSMAIRSYPTVQFACFHNAHAGAQLPSQALGAVFADVRGVTCLRDHRSLCQPRHHHLGSVGAFASGAATSASHRRAERVVSPPGHPELCACRQSGCTEPNFTMPPSQKIQQGRMSRRLRSFEEWVECPFQPPRFATHQHACYKQTEREVK